jgi:hypothetical protein
MTDQAVTAFDRSVADSSGEALMHQTGERLIADGRTQSGAITVPTDRLDSVNVNRQTTSDGSITNFPNGVKVGRLGDGSYSIEAPPGGKGVGDVVYDSHHKVVAKMDKDQTWHVFTKNGEYTDSADGKVTFKPSGHNTDLESLHKSGVVKPAKFEDYGLSTDGKTTRFPNGIEYNHQTHQLTIPAEHSDASQEKITDDAGRVTKTIAHDGDGKILYTVDKTGLHIPTKDGLITESANGTVTFESTKGANDPSKGLLPKLEISGH